MQELQIGIFFLVAIFGFATFLIYKAYLYFRGKRNDGREKNYYYNRFMRNKENTEKYIEVLQHTIALNNCGNEVLDKTAGLSVQQYLEKLKTDYEEDYTEVTQKLLKKNRLERKHKKTYIRLLSNQSEKLYTVENILTNINQKYRS